jgi:NAD(P)-dependent dehydrogenase (short-subunit alcohol dehydrogenase family)
MATPEDIGDMAVFLASEESRYVTGQLLAAAGRWGCRRRPGRVVTRTDSRYC